MLFATDAERQRRRRRRHRHVIPHVGAAGRRRPPTLIHRIRDEIAPDADGDRHLRRRPDRHVHRHVRPGGRAPAVVHRRHRRPVVPAAGGRVPLDPRAAQGRADEPAVDRRRLRRRRGGVPVGLGQGPHRPRVDRADRLVRADVHVRHPLRPVDGLRGVPALPGPRGVPAHGRQHRSVTTGHRRPRPGSSPRRR